MIQLQNIFLAFGGRVILDGVSWTIRRGMRIGLVGPNGAGKTTLLRLIAGEQPADDGSISYGGFTTGYLKQETQESLTDRTVMDEALDAFSEILTLESREKALLAEMERLDDHESDAYRRAMHRFNDVHEKLLALDVHLIRPRTEAVLTGLGFDPDGLHRSLSTFSGGWRMRVALARLLLTEPDVLLLDEPTNHLDLDSIEWLEDYLKNYPGTVVLVSHDRTFLDRMTTTTAELIGGHLTEYAGNYAFYLNERTIRREHQRAAYVNQQKMIADTERFIERFRYKATKATQVQSRVKQLEKLERVPEPPSDQATISFRFPDPPRSGKVVLELSEFSKTYETENGPIRVFDDAGPLHIERGDKIAMVGRNGAGKSTLARMMLGTEPFDGRRKVGHNVEMTFFAQHQAESLDRSKSALDALRETAPGRSETELRTVLGAFLFRGEDVFKKVAVLSGGERSRLALARTLSSPANLLILDEPTNHLDIQSIEVLTEALRQYTGSFVVVSHDRHFLSEVTGRVWRVEDGVVVDYPGSFREYFARFEEELRARSDAADAGSTAAKSDDARANGVENGVSRGPKSKEQKRREAEERRRRAEDRKKRGGRSVSGLNDYKLRQEYERLEKEIVTAEKTRDRLEAKLADPDTFADPAHGKELYARYEAVQASLSEMYKRWEEAAEEIAERDLG
ncbi:MAG: ABC-F family ATP-binding cassette domain-containing protein [Rhodothermales bacterium]|nr:ABC-F family ATP-binding cassette domain-containing protein [Rhodothermales bacterium]